MFMVDESNIISKERSVVSWDFILGEPRGDFCVQAEPQSWQGGHVVALLGANGAGKSSFLRLLAGLDHLSQGRILLGDDLLSRLSFIERAQKLAWLGQEETWSPGFTVDQWVDTARTCWMEHPELAEFKSRKDEALEFFGLHSYRSSLLERLSGGFRQRVALARLAAQGPRLWLLDEPTRNLDMTVQRDLARWIRLRQSKGDLIFIALHDLDYAYAVADFFILIKDGKLSQAYSVSADLSIPLETCFGVPFYRVSPAKWTCLPYWGRQ
jgi:iron complex transport system ATP-binding protein